MVVILNAPSTNLLSGLPHNDVLKSAAMVRLKQPMLGYLIKQHSNKLLSKYLGLQVVIATFKPFTLC